MSASEADRLLLEIHLEMGVDEALCEEPQDRFARPAPPPPVAANAPVPAAVVVQAAPVGESVVAAAVAAAQGATTLAELKEALERFEGCALKSTATHLVFEDGKAHAPLMLVGQVPDREEDLAGRPFAGSPGLLLDRMLAAIGLDRDGVYLASAAPWRPPGNRALTPTESAICRAFLERQITLAAPKMLLLLGGAPARQVLDLGDPLARMRGRWFEWRGIPTLVSLPPSWLVRQPLHKRLAWCDLLALKAALEREGCFATAKPSS